MRNTLLTLVLFTVALTARAQNNLYQAVKANEGAEYVQFFNLTEKDGKYMPTTIGKTVKLKLLTVKGGIPIGFEAINVETNEPAIGYDELSRYERVDHYPTPMFINHKHTGDGYIVMDDFILYCDGLSKSEAPKVSQINKIYVKKRESTSTDAEPEKKKKKKGLFSKMKSALTFKGTPEQEYIYSLDLQEILNDYFTKMKAKQGAYKVTTKDKNDLAVIAKFRDAGEDYIKRYNDSLYNTPKAIKDRETWAIVNKGSFFQVKNNSSNTLFVSSSDDNFISTEIPAGSSREMNCTNDLYYFFTGNKGKGGKKFYTANSACGSSVTIN